GRGLERRARPRRLANAHVERDLLQPRGLHHGAVSEPAHQLGQDLVSILLPQPGGRRGLCLCGRCLHHVSSSVPVRFATRLRRAPSRTMPTRVGLLSPGSSSITLEMSIGPSFSMIPPASPPRCVSFSHRGRWCRLTIFRPSTKTRRRLGSVRSPRPVLPRSLPPITTTWSSFRILIFFITRPRAPARRSS